MAALQFVHVPGYAALLLRKTFADLNQPGALIPRAFSWLGGTAARSYDGGKAWEFPCAGGGTSVLKFGYLDNANDIYQYQSSEFQFIGFDELTHFREQDYRYLFSRLRKLKGVEIPLRMRSGSNPGGRGHEWVKRRFIQEGTKEGRVFVPARLTDNPYLDQAGYIDSLSNLAPVVRKQLMDGNWEVRDAGNIFQREWFKIQDSLPANIERWCRFWDLAATEQKAGSDPDWTCGALLGLKDGQWWLKDMKRFRGTPKTNESIIHQTAMTDPPNTIIRMEMEGGASGKSLVDHYARNILCAFNFSGVKPLTDKVSRAGAFSSAAEAGNVILFSGQWVNAFLDEVDAFPEGNHDDQIDACTGAMEALKGGAIATVIDHRSNVERFEQPRFHRGRLL